MSYGEFGLRPILDIQKRCDDSVGFPDSVIRFLKLIPMLTDPASHGGDAADAFDVVVPSLPAPGRRSVQSETQLAGQAWHGRALGTRHRCGGLQTWGLAHPRFYFVSIPQKETFSCSYPLCSR